MSVEFNQKRERCRYDPACVFPELVDGMCRQHLYDNEASFSYTLLYTGMHWMLAMFKPFTAQEVRDIWEVDRLVAKRIRDAATKGTQKERVLACVRAGLSTSAEISAHLRLSLATVSSYLSFLCDRGEIERIGQYRVEGCSQPFGVYAGMEQTEQLGSGPIPPGQSSETER